MVVDVEWCYGVTFKRDVLVRHQIDSNRVPWCPVFGWPKSRTPHCPCKMSLVKIVCILLARWFGLSSKMKVKIELLDSTSQCPVTMKADRLSASSSTVAVGKPCSFQAPIGKQRHFQRETTAKNRNWKSRIFGSKSSGIEAMAKQEC